MLFAHLFLLCMRMRRSSRDLLVVISSYHIDEKIVRFWPMFNNIANQSIFHNVRQGFTEPVLVTDDSSNFQVQLSWGPTIVHSGLARGLCSVHWIVYLSIRFASHTLIVFFYKKPALVYYCYPGSTRRL